MLLLYFLLTCIITVSVLINVIQMCLPLSQNDPPHRGNLPFEHHLSVKIKTQADVKGHVLRQQELHTHDAKIFSNLARKTEYFQCQV